MKRIRRNRGRRTATMVLAVAAAALALHGLADRAGLFAATMQDSDTWRGLAVAPEHRCAPYNRADYPYPAIDRSADRQRPGQHDLRPV